MCTYSTGSRIGFFLVKLIKKKNNTIKKEKENMRLNKKSGFTLLEIIIVIIIIGVLASLALPRLFRTVEYSRSTEALNAIAMVRRAMERYALQNANSYVGAAIGALDVDDPSNNVPATNFTYNLTVIGATTFTIAANRLSVNGGTTGDWIYLFNAAGTITRSGNGAFSGIH